VAGSPLCKRITIDRSTGKVWVVTDGGRTFSYTRTPKKWAEPSAGVRAKDICSF